MASWKTAYEDCEELKKFKGNWDGANPEDVLDETVNILNSILINMEKGGISPPDIKYPASDGSVWAEWVCDEDRKIITVSRTGKLSIINW